MNGLINILKPPGMTSSNVVVFLRKELQIKKVGHTGTLDPEAAGVLPICLGKATRLADYIMHQDKSYRCYMKLGISTDSSDLTGNIISKSDKIPSLEKIKSALDKFQGQLYQVPPMHSAIKVDGKKLYELARQGIEVERKPRQIWVKKNIFISILSADMILFDTICSKGTYIRALCRDIGEFLGCGAVMAHLIRTTSGDFHIRDSHSLEEVCIARDQNKLNSLLIPMGKALENIMPSIILRDDCKVKIVQGNQVDETYITNIIKVDKVLHDYGMDSQTVYSIFCGNTFVGIGYLKSFGDKKVIKMKKVLV